MHQWIKFKDKKPSEHEECLVSFQIWPGDDDGGACFHLATFVTGKFLTWELSKEIRHVTHWMPLPEGPNEQ